MSSLSPSPQEIKTNHEFLGTDRPTDNFSTLYIWKKDKEEYDKRNLSWGCKWVSKEMKPYMQVYCTVKSKAR